MAQVRVRYEPSQTGLRALAVGPEAQAAVRAAAVDGKAFAESISPRSGEEKDADEQVYAESFEVTDKTVTVNGLPRAASRLTNTSTQAAAVEYGRGGRAREKRGQRVLGRTAARGGTG